MSETMRQQAARLADEVEASGIVGWGAKINFAFMFTACLTGVYGVQELRKALGGEKTETAYEGFFHEFSRKVPGAAPDGAKQTVADGD